MTQFESPASSISIEWATLKDALLIIEVTEVVKDVKTVHGLSDAVRATITPVDGPSAGAAYADTLVFPRFLQSQLKSKVGKTVLGRLGQGEAQPKQSPPWILSEATDADKQAAGAFLAAQAAGRLTAEDI